MDKFVYQYPVRQYFGKGCAKVTSASKHIPETLPEDLDPDDITTLGRPDDAGIDMPGNANGTEAWLRRIGMIK